MNNIIYEYKVPMNLNKNLDRKNQDPQTQERKIFLTRWARDCKWKREPLKKITHLMQGIVLTDYKDVTNKIFIPTFQKILAGHTMHHQVNHQADSSMSKLTMQYQDQVFGVVYISNANVYKMLDILFCTQRNQKNDRTSNINNHNPIDALDEDQDHLSEDALHVGTHQALSLSYCQKFIAKKILSAWLKQIVTDSYVDRKKAQTFQFISWEYIWKMVDQNSMEQKHVFYVHYAHDIYQDLYVQLPFESVVTIEKMPMEHSISEAEKMHRSHQLRLNTQIVYPLNRLRYIDHVLKLQVGDKIPLFAFSGADKDIQPAAELRWIYHHEEFGRGVWGQNGDQMTFLLQNFSKKYV